MKRVNRRRMDELREEIGVQMSLMGRLVKFWLRWAGHLVQMWEERMPKRVDILRKQGKRKRGRSRLRWKDCVRRDICKVGVVGEWRELAEDRVEWRSIVVKVGQKCGAIGMYGFCWGGISGGWDSRWGEDPNSLNVNVYHIMPPSGSQYYKSSSFIKKV